MQASFLRALTRSESRFCTNKIYIKDMCTYANRFARMERVACKNATYIGFMMDKLMLKRKLVKIYFQNLGIIIMPK